MIIGVPIAELYVFVQMSHAIGFFESLLILAAISIAGGWIVKRQGLRVWRRFQSQVRQGEVPTREIADGVSLLIAGALLLTPGFITDAIGILLLLPPVRMVLRRFIGRRGRTTVITATHSGPTRHVGIIDTKSEERD